MMVTILSLRRLSVLVPVVLIFSTSCSFTESKAAGERAVDEFHKQFNAEHYHDIYVQSDAEFRNSSPESELVALLEAIHRKLGTVKEAHPAGFFVNSSTFGTRLSLDYQTEFTEGKASEQFVYTVSGGKATLVGYHINSPLLILK